jgi:hypothetical protein
VVLLQILPKMGIGGFGAAKMLAFRCGKFVTAA